MKILYILPTTATLGGIERIVCDKANAFVESGLEVHVITYKQEGKPNFFQYSDKVLFHHLSVRNLDKVMNRGFIGGYFDRKAQKKVLSKVILSEVERINPDIAISICDSEVYFLPKLKNKCVTIAEYHFSKNSFIISAQTNKSPLRRFIHTSLIKYGRRKLINCVRKLDAFVVLTKEDLGLWHGFSNIHCVPNFTSMVRGVTDEPKYDSKRVISVGRLCNQKRFDFLIHAWSLLAKQYPDWKLSIFGDGPLRESLQAQIDSLGISESIVLEGLSTNIIKEYANSSIFAISSLYEGLPLVMLETMQSKLPIVSLAFQCGPRDLVDHNRTGLLVEDMDNPQKLADALMLMMDDEERRMTMGCNAFEKAKEFSKERIIEQWIELFKQLSTEFKNRH